MALGFTAIVVYGDACARGSVRKLVRKLAAIPPRANHSAPMVRRLKNEISRFSR